MFRGYVGKFFDRGLPTMFQPSAFLRFFNVLIHSGGVSY